jgi:hypothetical protein
MGPWHSRTSRHAANQGENEMSTATKQWSSTAGPRQNKAFTKAVKALSWKGKSHVDITDFGRSYITEPFAEPSKESVDAADAIGEQFGWEVNRDNCKAATEAFVAAAAALVLPEVDKRTSSDEQAERQQRMDAANRERLEQDREAEASQEAILSKVPDDAGALIVAELHEDKSDIMTDYHNHTIGRRVVIGWRKGKRENFAKLREAAAGFSETAHLGPGCDVWSIRRPDNEGRMPFVGQDGKEAWMSARVGFLTEADAMAFVASNGWNDAKLSVDKIEHRENYTMGAGNYLKAGHSDASGWAVKSVDPKGMGSVVYEDGLPN